MKLVLRFVVIVCLFSGCGSKNSIVPSDENVIPFQQMQLILKDIHLVDGLANREGDPNGTTEVLTKAYYKAVFNKHHVSDTAFYRSFKYYMYEANQLDSMYNNIVTEISKEQAKIQAE